MFNKYLLEYDDKIYYNINFDEIVKLLLKEKINNLPLTNRLLLVEMLKIICIIEEKKLLIVSSNKQDFNKLFDYILNINDEKSIINLINDLKIAKIV
ncbi:hypothetical protein LI034_15295 [Clostridium perfringens]|uniref:Rhoptry protein n=1 Tax=Clostridium perfringens D str. JGS1721 TaxID=488537 RepID=B1V366_CLOPF|nr:hypothetical protein [Clostridium perfringens]MDU7439606.1 hypothetical protein [Clostridium sp.]EDT71743.1 rhoptry protein [Clostridium perfringens D str. JGS1721]EJT6665634.1 hypothetical protein [Clostridium perfringens]MCX0362352.1 hypothetical protein [Clostridium perfringens]MDU7550089.1 hypothetical protein [Clostridium perfringens]